MSVMSRLTLTFSPNPAISGLHREPQLCYSLLSISATGPGGIRPVNWSLVADASRSMRIPIVDEAQFRALIRAGGAQETLVDGVPVWQLSGPVPPDVRAVAPSALDHVARALHTVVEQLGGEDRFALIATAEEALLLVQSTSGGARADLAHGIERLKSLSLGDQTDLAKGLALALDELRRGRDGQRAERLLLLTDGFTQRPEVCLQLAAKAAEEGVSISTVGLGGEFQDDVLTALADRSGGRAIFLRRPADIPQAIAHELRQARAVAARAVTLHITPAAGVTLRRATSIRPVLTTLHENAPDAQAGDFGALATLHLGDLANGAPFALLLEFLSPPRPAGTHALAQIVAASDGATVASATLEVNSQSHPPALPEHVLDAAARAGVARLQRRALHMVTTGATDEAIRLLKTAATRLDELGERSLAEVTRSQADALTRSGQPTPLATKEITYATRRLGGDVERGRRGDGETGRRGDQNA
jgi:hypothetical protein